MRVPLARELVERLAVERLAVERLAVERVPLRVEPVLAFAVLALGFDARELVLDREFERDAAGAFCVIAVRSLSKSLSACLLVFAASRRSAASAAVTSL